VDRHILYIINPVSGTKDKGKLQHLIALKSERAGFRYSFYPSVSSGDYTFLEPIVAEEHVTDIVIAGGDGTINGVINSLRHLLLPFGILPFGSGNGLALSAHLPTNPSKALDIIFKGKAKWIDAFTINERFGCMLGGLGFDAQVAHDFANDPSRGLTTYIKNTVSNFFAATVYPFTIAIGNESWDTEAFFISIANSNQFGNNFTIAPKASLMDGLLDIVIVNKQGKMSVLFETLRQVAGYNQLIEKETANSKSGIIYLQTDQILISNSMLAPLHIDGDPAETSELLKIDLLPGCFQLLFP